MREWSADKIERGNRVFPVSDHSSDVIAALSTALKKIGWKVSASAEVDTILAKEGHFEKGTWCAAI